MENLVEPEQSRRSEYARRRKNYDEKTVHPKLLTEYEDDGWIHVKDLKSGAKVRKPKGHDERVENRVWCILYQFGYPCLNKGRNFKLEITDGKKKKIEKQIDVFAKDTETVVVVECKSSESPKKWELRKDLAEMVANQKPIADAVRKHFGGEFKPKILWAFATTNVIWKDADLAYADANNIQVIRDREIRYLEEISRNLKGAGRYQFHAEFFEGQKIPELQGKTIPAIRTKLGGQTCYMFCVNPQDLLKISFVNHRDLRDPAGAPSYQRLLKQARLKKIAKFLDSDGYFPNSILINFKKKITFHVSDRSYDKSSQFGSFDLPSNYKSCWIIDGQHRLYGAALAEQKLDSVCVIAFDNIPQIVEASLFATINSEQQRVQKRLLDELEGELKWDSPVIKEQLGAIASRAVDLLNSEIGGPFHDRVLPPGMTATSDQNLTLPQIKLGIMQSRLIGRHSSKTDSIIPGAFTGRDNEATLHRLASGLAWYFEQIRESNTERWEREKGGFLRNNFGIPGHIRFLGEVCDHLERTSNQTTSELELKDLFEQLLPLIKPTLEFIKTADEQTFEDRFKVEFGSGGTKQYFYEICSLLHDQEPSFAPEGFSDHLEETSEELIDEADKRIKWITKTVHDHVVTTLEENYGDNFFEAAIASKDIKGKAYTKRMDDPPERQGPPEVYLDFLDLRKIVEYKENWNLFEGTLNIKMPNEQKGRAKYVNWFEVVNKIRRVPAHSYGRRYEEQDFQNLAFIEEMLREKLPDYADG